MRQPTELRDTEASQKIDMVLPPGVELDPEPRDLIVYRFLRAVEEVHGSRLSQIETKSWKDYAQQLEMRLLMAQEERRIAQDDCALTHGGEEH